MPNFIRNQISKLSVTDWVWFGTAVMTGAAALWAYLADWFTSQWAPLTILLLLGVIAFGVLIADRISAMRSRRPFKPLAPKQLQDTIQAWFIAYKFTVTQFPQDSEQNSKAHFTIVAIGEDGISIQIALSRQESMLQLNSFYTIPDNLQAAFDELTADTDGTMLDDVRIELGHFEVGYTGMVHPLREITISDRMLYDETFTQFRFMEKATHVTAAYSVVEAVIRRAVIQSLAKRSRTAQPDHPTEDEENVPTH